MRTMPRQCIRTMGVAVAGYLLCIKRLCIKRLCIKRLCIKRYKNRIVQNRIHTPYIADNPCGEDRIYGIWHMYIRFWPTLIKIHGSL
jgi:hypothetical protein